MYWLCAERFNWTPNQVDEQPIYLVESVLRIASLKDEVEQEKMAK